MLTWLLIAARNPHLFLPRIPNIEPRSWGGHNLPAGLALSRDYGKSRVYVAGWDEATEGCPPGVVNGWDGRPQPITVLWADVERWLPLYWAEARARQRERDKAGAAATQSTEQDMPGCTFIDIAVNSTMAALECPSGPAWQKLLAALQAGHITAWMRHGPGIRRKLQSAHWIAADVDLEEFGREGSGGLILNGKKYIFTES
jgi:hypothetical protein